MNRVFTMRFPEKMNQIAQTYFSVRSILGCCLTGLLLVLVSQFALADEFEKDRVATNLYGKGVHAFFDSNYREAIQIFSRLEQLRMTDPRPYYFLGLSYHRLKNTKKGDRYYQKGAYLEWKGRPIRDFGVSEALKRIQGNERMRIEYYRAEAQNHSDSAQVARDREKYKAEKQQELDLLKNMSRSSHSKESLGGESFNLIPPQEGEEPIVVEEEEEEEDSAPVETSPKPSEDDEDEMEGTDEDEEEDADEDEETDEEGMSSDSDSMDDDEEEEVDPFDVNKDKKNTDADDDSDPMDDEEDADDEEADDDSDAMDDEEEKASDDEEADDDSDAMDDEEEMASDDEEADDSESEEEESEDSESEDEIEDPFS